MGLLRFIPIKLTLFLVLGILVGFYLDISLIPSLITVLVSFSVLVFFYFGTKNTKSIGFGVFACATITCLGVLCISYAQPKNRFAHYTKNDFRGSHVWSVKVKEVLKANTFSDRYIVAVRHLDSLQVDGKLMLNIKKDSSQNLLKIDDELIVYAEIKSIRPALNPHQFDYADYMKKLGVYHEIRIQNSNYVLGKQASTTILGIAAKARNHIISKLESADFGKDELGVIKALLLGQRNDISEATYTNYKNAGAVHILAVSGLHIGIVLFILQFFLKPLELLPKGKTIKLITVVILLWGFAFLAGLSASVVRAVTMFSFVAYALYLNRPSNTFNILALSMFAILLFINPLLLFQVGFQMSYAAVFAIIWIYPLLQKSWFPKNIFIRKVWQLLAVSVAAQLGVLPVSLFYFHQFPGLFFISNLLVVPFLGLILGTGILIIMLSLFDFLPPFVVFAYDFMIKTMNAIIAWVAQQETFIFKNISFDIVQLCISYLLIICLVLALSKASFKKWAIFLSVVIGFQFWTFYTSYQNNEKDTLVLLHQNKNSILIYRQGDSAQVFSRDTITEEHRILSDYSIGERIDKIRFSKIQNSYTFTDKKILTLDSAVIYPPQLKKTDYLILTQSPKINLERVLDSVQPKYIIADGSNYKSYIKRWEQTCTQRNVPFHYTGRDGAFYFKQN
ncbi:ComEC/Rec2 family competence protein [Costertonia aggregata]|uniref:ComEC/Rec2 family competence protein n=1 Tax=Costertonia aggregata TaxID=343403 RepID=A0A7H9AQX1_9FLAO|nr:ComEC/Rec2 family competence protein [Costertonia aggregata]QLG45799.1 ComEC/Rec2 family competence protein [Costertonia aggregata]